MERGNGLHRGDAWTGAVLEPANPLASQFRVLATSGVGVHSLLGWSHTRYWNRRGLLQIEVTRVTSTCSSPSPRLRLLYCWRYRVAVTTYEFEAEPWRWAGNGAQWVFVTVPEDVSDEVEAALTGPGRGFGAVRVRVTIGATTWDTSMFPSTEHRAYILPLKAAARKAERVEVGEHVRVRISPVAR